MGLEKKCSARIGGKRVSGTALLESAEIRFRGDTRLVIAFKDIRSVTAEDGRLEVDHAGGKATFELGADAAKWVDTIKNPKSLIDKLGVKPGMRVAMLGIKDASFAKQVAARTDDVWNVRPRKNTDLIFVGLDSKSQLERLRRLRGQLEPNGAIWVVWPKGRPELGEADIRAAAFDAELVDVKVAAFSATHSALKLVIPVAKR